MGCVEQNIRGLKWCKQLLHHSYTSCCLIRLVICLTNCVCRFLLEALEDLDCSLKKLNSRLFVVKGQPTDVFPRLLKVCIPACHLFSLSVRDQYLHCANTKCSYQKNHTVQKQGIQLWSSSADYSLRTSALCEIHSWLELASTVGLSCLRNITLLLLWMSEMLAQFTYIIWKKSPSIGWHYVCFNTNTRNASNTV